MPDDSAPVAYETAYRPRCGAETGERVVDGRPRCWCPECDVVHWHAAVPVVGVVGVGGVAVVDDCEVLPFHHERTGKFDLPSGHQELPESAAETAVRERREETNLRVDPDALELLDVTVKAHPLGRYNFSTTSVAAASEATGEPEPETDADVLEWTTVERARESDDEFVPGVVDVLDAAVNAMA